MRMIFFDTETTGLDFKKDRIIELACLVIEDGNVVHEFDRFIKQDIVLSDEIKDLTGITDELLDAQGLHESFVAVELYNLLKQDTLMIAHNCQFDLNFIFELLCRYYGEEKILDLFSSMSWLDTLTVFKDRKDYPHRLENMVDYYEVGGDIQFHRAIDDTRALSKCVQALNRERNDVMKYVNVFGFNSKYGVSGREFSFIRYVPQGFNRGIVGKDFILPLL